MLEITNLKTVTDVNEISTFMFDIVFDSKPKNLNCFTYTSTTVLDYLYKIGISEDDIRCCTIRNWLSDNNLDYICKSVIDRVGVNQSANSTVLNIKSRYRKDPNNMTMNKFSELKEYYDRIAAREYKRELTPAEKQEKHIDDAKKQLSYMNIKKVIFNDNATIVFWGNNTKTVVKCCECDCYSKEAAIAIAYFKHNIGNECYHYVMDALTGNKGSKVDTRFSTIDIVDIN